jgi:hypothetical protein
MPTQVITIGGTKDCSDNSNTTMTQAPATFYLWMPSSNPAGAAYFALIDGFTGGFIPAGSTITQAKLTLNAASTKIGSPTGLVGVQSSGTITKPSSVEDGISRPMTSSVVWTPPAVSVNSNYDSPDFKTVLQTYLDSLGANMDKFLLILRNNASPNNTYIQWRGSMGTVAPTVTLAWTEPAAGGGGSSNPQPSGWPSPGVISA